GTLQHRPIHRDGGELPEASQGLGRDASALPPGPIEPAPEGRLAASRLLEKNAGAPKEHSGIPERLVLAQETARAEPAWLLDKPAHTMGRAVHARAAHHVPIL